MNKYGNILIVYDRSKEQLSKVEETINRQGLPYVKFESTFFLQTSKTSQFNVLDALDQLNVKYIFFHNHRASGSQMYFSKVKDQTAHKIRRMIFENEQ